jgi:plastocyanin
MSRGSKWRGSRLRGSRFVASVCLTTGCVLGSLAIGMGIAGAAGVMPGPAVTMPATTVTTTPTTTAATAPATTSTLPVAPTEPTTPTTPSTTPALSNPFQPLGSAATAHVSIVDFGYSPATITVTVGTTVTWTNTGTVIHSVTADGGAFDSSPSCPTGPCINPGSAFSHVFATAGTFTYHCRVHSNMHGTVIVQAAAAPTTTTQPGSPATDRGLAGTATTAAAASGPQLAFTGVAGDEMWIALGALFTIALGLALRPRRRPFPIPVHATDSKPAR